MLNIKLDMSGEFEVRLPQDGDEVIALATRYLAHESSLPEGQRLPVPALSSVQEKTTLAQAAMDAAINGEADRAAAAEQLRQGVAQARSLLSIATLSLRVRYASNLAQLEHWGLQTRTTPYGVTVKKPESDNGIIEFLKTYVAREQSLSAEARISEPPLASLVALANTIEQSLTVRRDGTTQRTMSIEARTVAMARLVGLLGLAAHALVVTRYEGRVTTALESWGFAVEARTTPTPAPAPIPPPP